MLKNGIPITIYMMENFHLLTLIGENKTMQKKVIKFNAQQLFDSLPEQEREQINSALLNNSSGRERERYL